AGVGSFLVDFPIRVRKARGAENPENISQPLGHHGDPVGHVHIHDGLISRFFDGAHHRYRLVEGPDRLPAAIPEVRFVPPPAHLRIVLFDDLLSLFALFIDGAVFPRVFRLGHWPPPRNRLTRHLAFAPPQRSSSPRKWETERQRGKPAKKEES